ncbi:DUF6220 domain-containing protein [Haladaptatus salinisoli]|uniref:DUF6220 domain-containing protein n=1 Tax=Haladaptatus salinisoli TaxID=2884876 RepID=UPI001D0A6238|nr:DUF6220 domain-containing protein [Haladaptatus salinisoli]
MTTSRRVSWARYGYVLLAAVFAVCVLVQVYIAGMAVFVDPANWELHTTFVHLFGFVPFLLFGLALLGRLSRTLKLLPVGLYALVMVQYATAHLFGSLVAALHPVNAIVIFGAAVVALKRAWASASEAEAGP